MPSAQPADVSSLFEPYDLRRLTVKNRLMRFPMVISMAAPDGTVTEDLVRYYRVVAAGDQAVAEARRCMKYDAELEAESDARLREMGPAVFALSRDEGGSP